jgi:uncharacterized coiled-coil protein SlyX
MSKLDGKEIEIFRTGTHVDSAGKEHVVTQADLAKIASNYNPAYHEAPIVIGHPKDNAPAFGWVKSLRHAGDRLFAVPSQVQPEFEEMVQDGKFKKRSISLYPDGSLRHVGFLGAKPPAVKGLQDVEFTEDGQVTIEFAEDPRVGALARVFARLRDLLIEKFGADKVNSIADQWDMKSILQEPEDEPTATKTFEENSMDKEQQARLDALEKKQTEFSELLASKDKIIENQAKTIEAQGEKLNGLVGATKQAEIAAFCERLEAQGKLIPAQRPAIMIALGKLASAGTAEFGEGDAKAVKPVEQIFREFLDGLPVQVEFSEVARRERAGEKPVGKDALAMAAEIRDEVEKQTAAGHPISFAEAGRIVAKRG